MREQLSNWETGLAHKCRVRRSDACNASLSNNAAQMKLIERNNVERALRSAFPRARGAQRASTRQAGIEMRAAKRAHLARGLPLTSLPFSGSNVPEAIELLDASGAVMQTLMLSTNQVGSVQLVTDAATGEVVQRIEYDEFGRVLTDSAPGMQPFGFAGGLYDEVTKLVRFGARDYSAEVGRWIARDPITPHLLEEIRNAYEYANHSPIVFMDPTGYLPPGTSECVNQCVDTWTKCVKSGTSRKTCDEQAGRRARRPPPGTTGYGEKSAYARCRVSCGEDDPAPFDPNEDPICSQ